MIPASEEVPTGVVLGQPQPQAKGQVIPIVFGPGLVGPGNVLGQP